MLPPLDNRGLLPPGVHVGTIADIESAFATNGARQHLLGEFRRFFRERLIPVAADLELIASGSYFSDKAIPSDIDCTIMLPVSKIASHNDLMTLLKDGRRPGFKGSIWKEYRVDIIPSITGVPGLNNLVDFFQYVGPKSASLKNLHATDRRGVVKVEQWTRG